MATASKRKWKDLSEEEREKAREANKERKEAITRSCDELIAAIANGADADEAFNQHLAWQAKFWSYSWGNTYLIHLGWARKREDDPSLPPVTKVGSYDRWRKAKRQVRKGETGVPILVPVHYSARTEVNPDTGEEEEKPGGISFKVGHVFDISQTDGEDAPNFATDPGETAAMHLSALIDFATENGIQTLFEVMGPDVNGSSAGGTIRINADIPVGTQARTMIHELAHELLHQKVSKASDMARSLKEGEAEAVSVVVLRSLGHDVTGNGAAYIRSHGASPADVRGSLGRIQSVAKAILAHLFGEDKAED